MRSIVVVAGGITIATKSVRVVPGIHMSGIYTNPEQKKDKVKGVLQMQKTKVQTRPDIETRRILVKQRIEYLTEVINECIHERHILTKEYAALEELGRVYESAPTDSIDNERSYIFAEHPPKQEKKVRPSVSRVLYKPKLLAMVRDMENDPLAYGEYLTANQWFSLYQNKYPDSGVSKQQISNVLCGLCSDRVMSRRIDDTTTVRGKPVVLYGLAR